MDEEIRALDQTFVGMGRNPEKCMTCMNANGEPPWEDSPIKSYCIAYPRELGMRKPPSVYYEGADCEFYRGA